MVQGRDRGLSTADVGRSRPAVVVEQFHQPSALPSTSSALFSASIAFSYGGCVVSPAADTVELSEADANRSSVVRWWPPSSRLADQWQSPTTSGQTRRLSVSQRRQHRFESDASSSQPHENTPLLVASVSSTSVGPAEANRYRLLANGRSPASNSALADNLTYGTTMASPTSSGSAADSSYHLVDAQQHHAVIQTADERLDVYGYRRNRVKSILTAIVSVLTLGMARLILHWNTDWWVRFTADKCVLADCDHILIRDDCENITFRPVRIISARPGERLVLPLGGGKFLRPEQFRCFTYRKLTYFWHPTEMRFASVNQLETNVPLHHFHDCVAANMSTVDVQQSIITYGRNLIEVKLKPIYVLLFKEAISPFYIFQVFSVTVWYNDNYAYFASIIVLMSVVSISLDVIQIRRQERKLRSMVHTHESVSVLRDGRAQDVSSDTLVPGDVLLIPPHGCVLQCDAIVMTGTVIVNESMLTGESVPITKVALPDADDTHHELFSFKEHSKHVLFCGTHVLQTRFYAGKPVKAVVLRTAYSTLKGQLIRSIMYPKPVDFRFTKDLFKFVGFLACIACIGFLYTIAIMYYRGSSIRKIILRSLDIITIVVPPALPAAMSIGIFAAQMRLRAKQIFCISPSTINTCGAINTVCFDKTGTLTEDGLDFNCLRAVYQEGDPAQPTIGHEMFEFLADELPLNGELLKAVATCHSLTRIERVLNGDPLDLILFRKTGWILDEAASENVDETAMFDMLQPTVVRSPPLHSAVESEVELAVIRQFTFSSSLQRMSVIVHNLNEPSHRMHLYCKGAPEMIASLCRPETVPEDYQHFVDDYAQHGYRLIAVAKCELELNYVRAQKVKREQCETDMTLLGLIVMENRIKEPTTAVINQLNRANIRTVMITGDNLLTAMSVARECGIIRPNKRAFLLEASSGMKNRDGRTHLVLKQSVSSSEDVIEDDEWSSTNYDVEAVGSKTSESSYHLAISGPTLAVICAEYPELLEQLVCVCDVYARMSPDQKQLLVNKLQDVDYTVAMCGDGANDCAALKAAHAGISLSEAEASIAAPFTSKIPDIRCVPMVIREGRAALVTSFGVFKYMAGYSLTQFITIMQLYWLNTNLTDVQFLYIDLALITLVALFFGYTPACERLARQPPPTRLLSLASMLSIIGQLCIISSFQLFAFIYITYQPWFMPYAMPTGDDVEDRRSMQGTSIFCVSTFQYLTLAIIYSKGYPYRKTLLANKPMCLSLIALAATSVWLTVVPPDVVARFFEYDPIPYLEDRIFLLLLGLLSGVFSYLFETFVIQHLILDVRERSKKRHQLITGSTDRPRFERILVHIGLEPQWIRAQAGGSLSMPIIQKSPNVLRTAHTTLAANNLLHPAGYHSTATIASSVGSQLRLVTGGSQSPPARAKFSTCFDDGGPADGEELVREYSVTSPDGGDFESPTTESSIMTTTT